MHSFIYIITNGSEFKVGVSDCPEKRLNALQTGSPEHLRIVETFKLSRNKVFALEKECHKEIQYKYKKRREWFFGATEFHIINIVNSVVEPYILL